MNAAPALRFGPIITAWLDESATKTNSWVDEVSFGLCDPELTGRHWQWTQYGNQC